MPIIAVLHILTLGKRIPEFENKSIWASSSNRDRQEIFVHLITAITYVHKSLLGL